MRGIECKQEMCVFEGVDMNVGGHVRVLCRHVCMNGSERDRKTEGCVCVCPGMSLSLQSQQDSITKVQSDSILFLIPSLRSLYTHLFHPIMFYIGDKF